MRLRDSFFATLFCIAAAGLGSAQDVGDVDAVRAQIAALLAEDPDNRTLRLNYAKALFQTGRYDAAKYHLRYLMRTSDDPLELTQLHASYGQVLAKSPFSFQGHLSVLPSTNINKTSSNAYFDTSQGRFLITDGADEESGVGLRFGGTVNAEVIAGDTATIALGLGLSRNVYPDSRLSRSEGTARLTWTRRNVRGATQIAPYVTRFVYDAVDDGDSPHSTRYGLRLGQSFYLSHTRSVSAGITLETRDYDQRDYFDGPYYAATLGYRGDWMGAYVVNFGFGVSRHVPKQEYLQYSGTGLWAGISRNFDGVGQIGTDIRFDIRRYDSDFPGIDDARADDGASIGLSYVPHGVRIFDAAPKFSCRIHQNWSNVALYDFKSNDCAISFERKF